MLSLTEKIMLLSIDENKNKITATGYNLIRYGIKGAATLRLIKLKRIKYENKKVVVSDESSTGDRVLDSALGNLINKGKPISMNNWIYSYSSLNREMKSCTIESLEDKGILVQDEKRFLGLIPLKRYIITNTEEKKKVQVSSREVLYADSASVSDEDAFLISLAAVCGSLKSFLTKDEIKENKEKLKLIKKGEYYNIKDSNLNDVLKAVKNAIAAQTAASASAGS